MAGDYEKMGQAQATGQKDEHQAFLEWLKGQGILNEASDEHLNNWIKHAGVFNQQNRMKDIESKKAQFHAQYSGPSVPEAPKNAPQMQYNFHGSVAQPGIMENYANQAIGQMGNTPSALGDYWKQNQAKFAPPGQGDQYWNQVQGGLSAAKNIGNNAQDAYNQFAGSTPADTSQYYDYAANRATREVNAAAAGRGMLNSSGSLQQVADMEANLRGQQANANAQYGLQRSGLLGQLGASADNSARANLQNQLSWLQGAQQYKYQPLMMGAQVAGQVDANSMNRLATGAQIASMGQNALRNRSQDYFNNTMGMAGADAGWINQVYGGAAAADQNAWEQAQMGPTAAAREHLTAGQNAGAQNAQNLGLGIQAYNAYNDWQKNNPSAPAPGSGGAYPGYNGGAYNPNYTVNYPKK